MLHFASKVVIFCVNVTFCGVTDVASVFFLPVNHYLREFNILQKKKKKKTLTSWAQHDKTLQETIAFPDKLRKSLLIIQIQGTFWRIN